MQSSAVAPLPCMDVVVGHLSGGLLKSDGAAFGLSLIGGRYRIPGGEMPLSKSLRTLRMLIGSYVAATRVQASTLASGRHCNAVEAMASDVNWTVAPSGAIWGRTSVTH